MIRRFSKDSIEGRLLPLCADHWLYRATVRRVKTELSHFLLLRYSAEELWAECMCELDAYRTKRGVYRDHCGESLLDFFNLLKQRQPAGGEEYLTECRRLTALFAAMLMLIYNRVEGASSNQAVMRLMEQCIRMKLDYKQLFIDVQQEMFFYGNDRLLSEIQAYMDGETLISEAIAEAIEGLEEVKEAKAKVASEGQEAKEIILPCSNLRIGYKKLSRVLIVLDAMIQNGWIVDKEGKKPKNRDAALNQILQLAFGEEKMRQISSTMYPSHILSDEHEEYFNKIIDELLTGYKSSLS